MPFHSILPVILICLFSQSLCLQNSSAQSDSLVMHFQLTSDSPTDSLELFLSYGNVRRRVDTICLTNGKGSISRHLPSSTNQIELRQLNSRNRIKIWVTTDQPLLIEGEINDLGSATVSGSSYHDIDLIFQKNFNRDTTLLGNLPLISQYINSPSALERINRKMEDIPLSTLEDFYAQLSSDLKNHDFGEYLTNYIATGPLGTLKTGEHFSDFATIDGGKKNAMLSDKLGKKHSLLVFRSAYCPYALAAIPELENFQAQHIDDLKIITICTDTHPVSWEDMLRRDQVPWEVVWDQAGEAGENCIRYGVKGSPFYFLIDEKGVIAAHWFGYEQGIFEQRWQAVVED